MNALEPWTVRGRVRRFIHDTFEGVDEFEFHHGPTQAEVAEECFEGDFRQALSVLRDLERTGEARRTLSFGLYRWVPATAPLRKKREHARTEVTERILGYVTAEFNEGKAGNRRTLPTAHDVAKACLRGSGTKSCRRAVKHLHLLMASGEIIQVKDEDVNPKSWHYAFYALNEPGTCLGHDWSEEKKARVLAEWD